MFHCLLHLQVEVEDTWCRKYSGEWIIALQFPMDHDNGLTIVYEVRCFRGPHVRLQERYNVALLDSLAL
jgi:hypothetical protein